MHHDAAGRPAEPERSDLSAGMRGADLAAAIASELVGGLLVWFGIGWLVDRWLGTDPWFAVIGALLGYAGGMYLVWLRVNRSNADGTPKAPRTGSGGG